MTEVEQLEFYGRKCKPISDESIKKATVWLANNPLSPVKSAKPFVYREPITLTIFGWSIEIKHCDWIY